MSLATSFLGFAALGTVPRLPLQLANFPFSCPHLYLLSLSALVARRKSPSDPLCLSLRSVSSAHLGGSVCHARDCLLSQVRDASGLVVGVRNCCPYCKSNLHVDVTSTTYNISRSEKAENCGVRFVYGMEGITAPVWTEDVCCSPSCPANVKKLQKRSLEAASQQFIVSGKQLPEGKAPGSALEAQDRRRRGATRRCHQRALSSRCS